MQWCNARSHTRSHTGSVGEPEGVLAVIHERWYRCRMHDARCRIHDARCTMRELRGAKCEVQAHTRVRGHNHSAAPGSGSGAIVGTRRRGLFQGWQSFYYVCMEVGCVLGPQGTDRGCRWIMHHGLGGVTVENKE